MSDCCGRELRPSWSDVVDASFRAGAGPCVPFIMQEPVFPPDQPAFFTPWRGEVREKAAVTSLRLLTVLAAPSQHPNKSPLKSL